MHKNETIVLTKHSMYWWCIFIGSVCFATALVFMTGMKKPTYNFDLVGYIASSYQRDGLASEDILSKTQQQLAQHVPADMQVQFKNSRYRDTVLTDAHALSQQLPFYSIRVLYVENIRFLAPLLGDNRVKAAIVISTVFASLCVVVTALWLRLLNNQPRWLALGFIIVALAPGFSELGRMASADSMASFAGLVALLGVWRQPRLAMALAVVLPWIRTDYVLLSFLIAWACRDQRTWAIATVLASLAGYVMCNQLANNYGYLTVLNFTLLGPVPYPAEQLNAVTAAAVGKVFINNLYELITSPHMTIYLLGMLALTRHFNGHDLLAFMKSLVIRNYSSQTMTMEDARLSMAVAITIMFAVMHFLLFPTYMERFFMVPATVVLVVSITKLSRKPLS